MKKHKLSTLLALPFLGFLSHQIQASPGQWQMPKQGDLPSGFFLKDGKETHAPIAFFKFCNDYKDQCKQPDSASVISLDQEKWGDLERINREINARIAPDPQKHGFNWSLETTLGNCNDYAVQKRKALLEEGFPGHALSLTVVITPQGEGHLVLAIRTNRGDFILDNLRQEIVSSHKTGYKFVKRHLGEAPTAWVDIRGVVSSKIWSPIVDQKQPQLHKDTTPNQNIDNPQPVANLASIENKFNKDHKNILIKKKGFQSTPSQEPINLLMEVSADYSKIYVPEAKINGEIDSTIMKDKPENNIISTENFHLRLETIDPSVEENAKITFEPLAENG